MNKLYDKPGARSPRAKQFRGKQYGDGPTKGPTERVIEVLCSRLKMVYTIGRYDISQEAIMTGQTSSYWIIIQLRISCCRSIPFLKKMVSKHRRRARSVQKGRIRPQADDPRGRSPLRWPCGQANGCPPEGRKRIRHGGPGWNCTLGTLFSIH
jgi:hypothetical protein